MELRTTRLPGCILPIETPIYAQALRNLPPQISQFMRHLLTFLSICFQVWITYQMSWDERTNGYITRTSRANRQHPFLQLPAELRNLIWEYVFAPQFHPDEPFSVPALDQKSGNEQCAKYLAECTVDLYPPRKGVYPSYSIVLLSRNVYEETLAMYNAAVDRYYGEIPHRLKSWVVFPGHTVSPAAYAKLAATRDVDLAKISTLIIDARSVDNKPEMLFTNGAWRASWKGAGMPNNRLVRRHVVLYEPSRSSALSKALMQQGLNTTEYLQRGKKCYRDIKFDCPMDAVMLPYETNDENLRPVRAAARSMRLTKMSLEAILYIQCYMCGRY
jgi:hypothetical protein